MAARRPSYSLLPLFLLASAFAAGILCERLAAPPLAPTLLCGLSAALASLLSFFRRNRRAATNTTLVIVAFACAGAGLSAVERRSVGEERLRRFYEDGRIEEGAPVELTGVLVRPPEVAPDGLALRLRVERLRHRGEERACTGAVELFAPARDARARAEYEALELRRGARLRVLVVLARAERFRNPGVAQWSEFLERRELDAGGTIKSALLVERLDDERVALPLVWLDAQRARLIGSARKLFSVETAGIVNASLVGQRQGLTRDAAERFRESGTFHVLVVSGLHVTFVGGLVWRLARRITRRRAQRWAAATLCVWLYAVAVGAESSVVRAALMFTLATFAPVVARRATTVNALGGAALVLLAWRPSQLFDPSFQLTFLSVLAIVTLAWPLLSKLRDAGAWRPTQEHPFPPVAPRFWTALGELLYWSERAWRHELSRATYSYEMFKTPHAARLERWRLQRGARYLCGSIVVSTCVQVAMLPALVLYFHRLTPAALLLDIWVSLLMLLLSFAALAAMLLAAFSTTLAAPFVHLAEQCVRLMTEGVEPFTAVGATGLRLPEYTGAASLVYVLYYVPLVVLAVALARWRPVKTRHEAFDADAHAASRRMVVLSASVAQVLLFLVIVFHPLSAARPDGRLRINFLDVGQGDAALVTTPEGRTLLIDGGGRPAFDARAHGDVTDGAEDTEPFARDTRGIGEMVVSEYLWWRGLDRVDLIFATHADADHIDGLNDVLKNFRVGAALVGRAPADNTEFARFAKTAERAGVPVQLVMRGDAFEFGGASFEILWPPAAPEGTRRGSANEDSLVLRVRYGRRTFLLTGDIEARAEAALVAVEGRGLRCDALKVAHHGSRTSSTPSFVEAARPTLAVVPVGTDSPFGHPHAEVLARWRAAGARVLTTGERGMITVSTDGADLRVETFIR
ncbi:MAG TPA: ComEC/Rec2 family competence protein [Pyrinomonadaceae bacterium]|nr:ComEC/Rec2 family competence protein [Pyrinomonadaceae bacterium]